MLPRPPLLVFALLLSSAVHATPCANDNTQGCATSAAQTAEREMNTLYQQLLKQLGHGSVLHKRLFNTQRTWHSFRDAECEYLTTYGEQKGRHAQNYDRCVQAMTEQRIRALQHYQQCDEAADECTANAP